MDTKWAVEFCWNTETGRFARCEVFEVPKSGDAWTLRGYFACVDKAGWYKLVPRPEMAEGLVNGPVIDAEYATLLYVHELKEVVEAFAVGFTSGAISKHYMSLASEKKQVEFSLN